MKKKMSIYLIFFFAVTYGQEHITKNYTTYNLIEKGIGLGNVIAVSISWSKNKSILFAIIHGIFGWLYVIYTAIINFKKQE